MRDEHTPLTVRHVRMNKLGGYTVHDWPPYRWSRRDRLQPDLKSRPSIVLRRKVRFSPVTRMRYCLGPKATDDEGHAQSLLPSVLTGKDYSLPSDQAINGGLMGNPPRQ